MSALRHGPPLAMNGYMDKEGRKFRARKTRYFKLKDSALFNHRRKDSVRFSAFLNSNILPSILCSLIAKLLTEAMFLCSCPSSVISYLRAT